MFITQRYSPFREADYPAGVRLFQDAVSRLFSEPAAARIWTPAVDILETESELVLKADLPDVDPKEVQIEIEHGTLTMKGARNFEKKEDATAGYHRIERSYGEFTRCFSIPDTVDAEKVTADYKNGVLTVTLPKTEAAKPRTVKVEVVQ